MDVGGRLEIWQMIRETLIKWALGALNGQGFTESVNYEIGSVAAKEAAVINRVFKSLGVRAVVNYSDVIASPTGNFIRYPVQAYCKVQAIAPAVETIRVALSTHRGVETDVAFHSRYVLYLETTYPMKSRPLMWADAALHKLQPHQALLGMDYTATNPAPLMIDFNKRHIASGMIAGATGSGKTTLTAAAITSLCYATSPDDLQIIFVDPKQDEDWMALAELPHVTLYNDYQSCATAIASVRAELERRRSTPDKRRVILIIDEYPDLRRTDYGEQIDSDIASITAIGRSKNINVLLAAQKPTVEVVDTVAKGNLTTRICGLVMTPEESKIGMGRGGIGCEDLPGKGSFYAVIGGGRVQRLQSYLLEGEAMADAIDIITDKWRDVEPYAIALVDTVEESGASAPATHDDGLYLVLETFPPSALFDESGNPRHGIKMEIARTLYGDDVEMNGTVQREVNRILRRVKTEENAAVFTTE